MKVYEFIYLIKCSGNRKENMFSSILAADILHNMRVTDFQQWARDLKRLADNDEKSTQTCRQCGCTNQNKCMHPEYPDCHWVEKDLCSHCQDYPGESMRFLELFGA